MIVDMTQRLAIKKEKEEAEQAKAFFLQMFGDQPPHILQQIREAIINKDEEAYYRITEPIILRKTIKEFN